MDTTIPGIKAKHAIITDECRANRGDLGAFEEAMRRLKLEYDTITRLRHGEKGVNYHLVLVVEDTKRTKQCQCRSYHERTGKHADGCPLKEATDAPAG